MEQPDGESQEHTEVGWLDAEIRDSFPASDPLSHWAGPARPTSDADRAHHVSGDPSREERAGA